MFIIIFDVNVYAEFLWCSCCKVDKSNYSAVYELNIESCLKNIINLVEVCAGKISANELQQV